MPLNHYPSPIQTRVIEDRVQHFEIEGGRGPCHFWGSKTSYKGSANYCNQPQTAQCAPVMDEMRKETDCIYFSLFDPSSDREITECCIHLKH